MASLKCPVIIDTQGIEAREAETFSDTARGLVSWKTLISAPQTSTESLTVGMATCPPGDGHLGRHRHPQVELYHIVSGHGVVIVEGVEHSVMAGSVVFIPGNAEHGIRNGSNVDELKWLYVFGADSFADIQYTF